MNKICITCGKEFQVLTKVAFKIKNYCSAECTKGYYNTSNKRRDNENKRIQT